MAAGFRGYRAARAHCQRPQMKRLLATVAIVVIVMTCLVGIVQCGCSATVPSSGDGSGADTQATSAASADVGDAVLARAFADHASDLAVEGQGTVTKLLADDTEGSRHQRFIVQLASGQTLLVTHNVDVAPRVTALRVGDAVSFKGEYVWNSQGGLIHWTHHDPDGEHTGGWIEHHGVRFE
jgi:hypothetical protein